MDFLEVLSDVSSQLIDFYKGCEIVLGGFSFNAFDGFVLTTVSSVIWVHLSGTEEE